MKTYVYLLIDRYGAVEVRKRLPDPHLRQVAVRLSIEISDAWFVRQVPSIDLVIPDDHVQPLVTIQSEPMEQGEEL